MCSSPKSNTTIRKSRLKGVFEDMDPASRASFVATANAASDRRIEFKNAVAKRQKMAVTKSQAKNVMRKKKTSVKENFLLSFLHHMGFAV